MSLLRVVPYDSVFYQLECEPSVWREVQDHFTFEAPGAKFSPAYKKGYWNGLISLAKNYRLYAGLERRLRELAESRGWEYEGPPAASAGVVDMGEYVAGLDIPEKYEPRDYQLAGVRHCLDTERALLLSPTASGKSLSIYMIARYHERVLIIVPTINLTHQMIGDFRDYGYDGEAQEIRGGESRVVTAPIAVTTWQSAVKALDDDPEWMRAFDCVIVDECHLAKSTSIRRLLEAATDVRFRYGFTGTLDGSATNEMVLEGLLGPVERVISTRELMDRGAIAETNIRVITLEHPERARKLLKGATYQEEIAYLVGCEARNRFVAGLAAGIPGNVLVLFTRVEKHGAVLTELVREIAPSREVRFVHGGVDAEDREEVRELVADVDDAVIIASVGVFQLGANMPRLSAVILSAPYKSKIVTAQSIGRGLRLAEGKTVCDVYDVADDLSVGKRWTNHTLRHALERLRLYASEQLEYSAFRVPLRDDGPSLNMLVPTEEPDD